MSTKASWRVIPIIGARDVQKSAEYYRDALGFHLDSEHGIMPGVGEEGAVYALLSRDGIEIHIQIRRGEAPAGERAGIERDVYVRVPDVDAVVRELQERGTRLNGEPQNMSYGMREIDVEDPNGVRLTFASPA